MYKKLIGLLLITACGGEADDTVVDQPQEVGDAGTELGQDDEADEAELGQTVQALMQPAFYGTWGLGDKCNHPGQGSANCYLASSKTRSLKFHASTCSSWWQARMVAAEQVYKPTVANAGWTYLSGQSSGININIRCSTNNQCSAAKACAKHGSATCSGGICKESVTDIYVDVNEIEGDDSDWHWSTLTESQRRRVAENTFVHEVGHAFFLGHEFYATFGSDPQAPITPSNNNAMNVSTSARVNFWQNLNFAHITSDLTNYQP